LPNSRCALAVAEWARRYTPKAASRLYRSLFAAHFAYGEDIGDRTVVERHASDAGIPLPALRAALANGSAFQAVTRAEHFARKHGVSGTPAWLVGDHLIAGLRGRADFEAAASSRVRSASRKAASR
jgi:predicted DsbA family dithiol-disulfide isomerase